MDISCAWYQNTFTLERKKNFSMDYYVKKDMLIMLIPFANVGQTLFNYFDRIIIVLSTLISINYYILQIINF